MPLTFPPTSVDPILKLSKAKAKCEAKGGVWDEVTQTCKLPKPEEPKFAEGEVIRDEETGEITGITKAGSQFFLPKKEIENVSAKFQEARRLPAGSIATSDRLAAEQAARRKLILARNVGNIDFELASQLEEQGLNVREYLHAGVQGIDLKQAAIAATAGGAAGASAAIPTAGLSIPATAAIAAGGSLVLDFFNDVRANIKAQRQDLVTVKTKELRQRKTAMNNYIQSANMNPAEADTYILAYNIEKSLVIRDYNTLVKRGNEDLEFWGTDATPQIVEYEVFFESVQPSLDTRMQQAVLKPEPTRAFLSIDGEES